MANVLVRKAAVFATAFVLAGALMGSALVGISDTAPYQTVFAAATENELQAEQAGTEIIWEQDGTEGYYNEFVRLVQQSNRSKNGDRDFSPLEDVQAETAMGQAQFVYVPAIPLSEDLQRFTFDRCEQLGLEYPLVLAIMWRESRFTPTAVGYNKNGTCDNGIMQINDVNRAWLNQQHGISDLMDPYQNISAGTAILAEYAGKYSDINAVLMAYHYGEAGMKARFSQGITTNKQVNIALEKRAQFQQLIEQEQAG